MYSDKNDATLDFLPLCSAPQTLSNRSTFALVAPVQVMPENSLSMKIVAKISSFPSSYKCATFTEEQTQTNIRLWRQSSERTVTVIQLIRQIPRLNRRQLEIHPKSSFQDCRETAHST